MERTPIKPTRSSSRNKSAEWNIEQIINSVSEEFDTYIPTIEESSYKEKKNVLSELQLRKDISIAEQRKHQITLTELQMDDVCVQLDHLLTEKIKNHILPITEAAIKIAKNKIIEKIPNDPGDIGVALPHFSNKRLERAIEKKKAEIALFLVKEIEGFHFSWYSDDDTIGFDYQMNCWADTVRGMIFILFFLVTLFVILLMTYLIISILILMIILFMLFMLSFLLFIVIDIHDIIHGISDKIIGNIFYVIIYCMTYISTCQ